VGEKGFLISPANKMGSTKNTEPSYYNSRFRHGVDEKRRVQIPAKWRPQKAAVELTLILWPREGVGSCVRVLPPMQMAKLMSAIDGMPNSDPKKVVLKRIIGSDSAQASVDKAGRICLPEEMARGSGIKGEAVLVGLLDRFEIWSPESYEKVQAADVALAPDAFKLME
jgi:transcriptional regulator MraZ